MKQSNYVSVSKVCYVFLALTLACALIFILIFVRSNKEVPTPIFEKETKLNYSCTVWSLVGDEYCDDEANVPECGYDLKDCCQLQNDRSLCQDCYCHIQEVNQNCPVKNIWEGSRLGDSFCDLDLNSPEHLFDLGDCCLESLNCPPWIDLDYSPYDYCVDNNPCIESNIFCIPEELGDGICQDHNNAPFCHYDLGDCCLLNVNQTECCDCLCKTLYFFPEK